MCHGRFEVGGRTTGWLLLFSAQANSSAPHLPSCRASPFVRILSKVSGVSLTTTCAFGRPAADPLASCTNRFRILTSCQRHRGAMIEHLVREFLEARCSPIEPPMSSFHSFRQAGHERGSCGVGPGSLPRACDPSTGTIGPCVPLFVNRVGFQSWSVRSLRSAFLPSRLFQKKPWGSGLPCVHCTSLSAPRNWSARTHHRRTRGTYVGAIVIRPHTRLGAAYWQGVVSRLATLLTAKARPIPAAYHTADADDPREPAGSTRAPRMRLHASPTRLQVHPVAQS